MSDTQQTQQAAEGGEQGTQQQEQAKPEAGLTQADVDKIVKERVARERAKFADYDELKARAEGAKTVEQQLADLKAQNAQALAEACRAYPMAPLSDATDWTMVSRWASAMIRWMPPAISDAARALSGASAYRGVTPHRTSVS